MERKNLIFEPKIVITVNIGGVIVWDNAPFIFRNPMPVGWIIFSEIALLIHEVTGIDLIQKHLLDAGCVPYIGAGSAGMAVSAGMNEPLISRRVNLGQMVCNAPKRHTVHCPLENQADIGGNLCINFQNTSGYVRGTDSFEQGFRDCFCRPGKYRPVYYFAWAAVS